MTTAHKTCFQFKASFSPCTILQITHYDLSLLEKQIEATIARAPNIFLGSPVVIDLEKIRSEVEIDFAQLKQLLIKVGLAPMGVRGCTVEQSTQAAIVGLPLVNVGKTATHINHSSDSSEKVKPTDSSASARAPVLEQEQVDSRAPALEQEQVDSTDEDIQNSDDILATSTQTPLNNPITWKSCQTKIITHPVRSGMQVYAKEADLIIVGQVSPGAELLADGNIHVYGALRGRALAGLSGNTETRIFCRTLEAELVSIAGFYLTKEDIQALPTHHGMIQIYLENEQVKIEAL